MNINNSELLEEKEAAALCGLSHSYFRNLRRTGRGPTYVRPSPHRTLYKKSDLEDWCASWATVMANRMAPERDKTAFEGLTSEKSTQLSQESAKHVTV